MKKAIFSLATCLMLASCGGTNENTENDGNQNNENSDVQESTSEVIAPPVEEVVDDHTLSNYKEVHTTHLHLDLDVNFEEEKLTGKVTHTIENLSNADHIVFDNMKLKINKAWINDSIETSFTEGSFDELLGSSISVAITPETESVTISYESIEKPQAIDWLKPQQTAGKSKPFMFTQGQSIFTRSWIPCQDTPDNRITYSATISCPKDLMAVMSASNPEQKNNEGVYHFEMPQPIPSYLIALAVGDLVFEPIDERTGVYTEPSMIKDCTYELADMGKMVTSAEKLYGKYLWDRFDVIVLPPSFPFGGMENPRLTFATPTIIAGDRSLVALIAHELAHSWSGNLVTNSTWNDFWLNEGFTVYFERRIMEDLFGKDYTDMLAQLGYQDLKHTLEDEPLDMQSLKVNLFKRHPDDGFSDVPYEKGYFLLRLIEEQSGRENFDQFLKNYFETYKFQTIVTEDFIAYLEENLLTPNNVSINLNEWIYEPGLPSNCPEIVAQRFINIENGIEAFKESKDVSSIGNTNDWCTHEWLHFIRNIDSSFVKDDFAKLDEAYNLTQTGNSEIAAIWFEKSIKAGYDVVDPQLEAFLIKVGRRKFLSPLYKALASTPEGKEKALSIYEKARPNYHFVSFNTIDGILGLNG